jgi:hypothetical protein
MIRVLINDMAALREKHVGRESEYSNAHSLPHGGTGQRDRAVGVEKPKQVSDHFQ